MAGYFTYFPSALKKYFVKSYRRRLSRNKLADIFQLETQFKSVFSSSNKYFHKNNCFTIQFKLKIQ